MLTPSLVLNNCFLNWPYDLKIVLPTAMICRYNIEYLASVDVKSSLRQVYKWNNVVCMCYLYFFQCNTVLTLRWMNKLWDFAAILQRETFFMQTESCLLSINMNLLWKEEICSQWQNFHNVNGCFWILEFPVGTTWVFLHPSSINAGKN